MKTKIPFLITIFAIIGGVFISILFGADESIFKDKIKRDLLANPKVQSMLIESEKQEFILKESDKSWRYYQRYHFHATGIASLTLGLLLLLLLIDTQILEKTITSYILSITGFTYPFVWLLLGLYAPILGRTEAKKAFEIVGYSGGIYFGGVIFALYLLIRYPLKVTK